MSESKARTVKKNSSAMSLLTGIEHTPVPMYCVLNNVKLPGVKLNAAFISYNQSITAV